MPNKLREYRLGHHIIVEGQVFKYNNNDNLQVQFLGGTHDMTINGITHTYLWFKDINTDDVFSFEDIDIDFANHQIIPKAGGCKRKKHKKSNKKRHRSKTRRFKIRRGKSI